MASPAGHRQRAAHTRVLRELDVGVDRVEVTAEPGEGGQIAFGDGACRAV